MTRKVIWEGAHHEGGRGRAVYDGRTVVFEQAQRRDAMEQLIWHSSEDAPAEFLKCAAELMLQKGAPISGT